MVLFCTSASFLVVVRKPDDLACSHLCVEEAQRTDRKKWCEKQEMIMLFLHVAGREGEGQVTLKPDQKLPMERVHWCQTPPSSIDLVTVFRGGGESMIPVALLSPAPIAKATFWKIKGLWCSSLAHKTREKCFLTMTSLL
ncbi:UNVERIFIED_CONTAM: hypothetical protein K2H54_044535 [Gekko kuhli]